MQRKVRITNIKGWAISFVFFCLVQVLARIEALDPNIAEILLVAVIVYIIVLFKFGTTTHIIK